MHMPEFSRVGEPSTAFERQLVAQADTAAPREAFAQMVLLAQRIGVEALLVLLDEFGGEKIHIPKRSNFFGELWRPLRDAAVRKALRDGSSVMDVAREFGLSHARISRIAIEADR